MTEIQNDALAANAARNAIRDMILHSDGTGSDAVGTTAEVVADQMVLDHAVTWETDVNAAGIPVRRYVLRGEWEVDPAPPVHLPRKGDVVMFREEGDTGIVTRNHGVVPAGSAWVVQEVSYALSYALLLLAQPEWPEGTHISATAAMVRIVRRAS